MNNLALQQLAPDAFNFDSPRLHPFGRSPRLYDPLSAGIEGVTSLVGGLIGSSAASKAAAEQQASDKAAAAGVNTATTAGQAGIQTGITNADTAITNGTAAATQDIANAGTAQQGLYGTETSGLTPYQAAGTQGLSALQSTAGTFKAPTAAEAAATPGYQFQLQQGEQAIQNSAAARGMLQSGGTAKSLDQFSQGLASTDYQNAYNNSLTAFNTNNATNQTLANLGTNANSQAISAGSTYGGQLTSLAGLGANTQLQGAGLTANANLQGNESSAQLGVQGATAAGQDLTNAGNAQAAGTVGSANAWSSALGGVAGAATNYYNSSSPLSALASQPSQFAGPINPGSEWGLPISTTNLDAGTGG
jgi:hypothetical protein